MIGLINPWTIIGAGIALVISHGFVGIQAYNFGADRQRAVCELRVQKINEEIERQNKVIDGLKETWDRAIVAVQDAYNKDIAEESATADRLAKELADYERTINANPKCDDVIGDDDIKRVRR